MPRAIDFPPFRLDLDAGRLLRDGERVALRPKTLALLRYLAERPGIVVSRAELMGVLWAGTHVDEAAVKVCVGELRRALGDDASAPAVLETVRGLGYRFLPEVGAARMRPRHPPRFFVGRETELAALEDAFAAAARGAGGLVFVSGEAGIGKTSLVEAFLAAVVERASATGTRVACAIGRCADRPGAGDAFQPLVEALCDLARGAEEARLRSVLRESAPSWLLQLPGGTSPGEREALQRSVAGVTRAGMIRELVRALDALSETAPLLLALEDLHTADEATRDALAAIAEAGAGTRLLLLGTLRASDSLAADAPVATLAHELVRRHRASELVLGRLDPSAILSYLERRFGGAHAEHLAASLARHTEGHPLFLTSIADHVESSGALATDAGGANPATLAALVRGVPETLRELIVHEVERLPVREQALLEAAAVVGFAFTAPALAAALDEPLEEVESRLATIVRLRSLVRARGTALWADGTEVARYEFSHALYRDVVYERFAPAARAACHRRVGRALETALGGDAVAGAADVAAELALHFDRAGDAARAARYHEAAGLRAIERHAYETAVGHLERALDLVAASPDEERRRAGELRLRTALGPMLMNARGFASRDVEENYARALELCRRLGELPELFPVLEGLQSHYALNGSLTTAHEISRRMLTLAERTAVPAMRLEAHHAMGIDLVKLARLDEAEQHLGRVLELYDDDVAATAFRWCGHDPRVCCLAFLGLCRWYRGAPETAIAECAAALAEARALRQPASVALALLSFAWLRLLRGEADAAVVLLDELHGVAGSEGMPYWRAMAQLFSAWALAMRGQPDAALAVLETGRALCREVGPRVGLLEGRMIAAGLHATRGELEVALALLDEAATLHAESGERYLHGDILAIRGSVLLACGDAHRDAAVAALVEALEFARAHGLRPIALRAALALARPLEAMGERERARDVVAGAYGAFSEGFDLFELRLAEARLRQLEAPAPG